MFKRVFWLFVLALLWGCDDEPASGNGQPDVTDDVTGDVTWDLAELEDEDLATPPGCELDNMSEVLTDVQLDAQGLSDLLTFEVPECAHSLILTIEGPDDVTFIVNRLNAPNEEVWITEELSEPLDPIMALFLGPFPGQFMSPVRMVQGEGVAAALITNSSAKTFLPGTYEVVVQGARLTYDSIGRATPEPWQGTVTVEALWKNPDTLDDGGTLDVNLFFTGAGDLTAATAESSSLLEDAIALLTETYAQANITIGRVRYFDIDARYRTIRSMEGLGNDLSAMFKLNDGYPQGMNFFFVDRFDIQGLPGGAIAGIAGGIPGPALKTGTPRSGVAVSVAAADGDPEILGHVMAHEGAHYLGLFHVQEMFGAVDPLDDTPTGQQSDTNLMYPAVGGGRAVTADQARVMHNHPEVAR